MDRVRLVSAERVPLGRRRQLWLMDRQEEAVARLASELRRPRTAMAAACGMPIGALTSSALLTSVLPHDRTRDVERTYGLPSGTLHPLVLMPTEEEARFDADPRLRYLLDAAVERDETRVDVGDLVDRLSELSDQGLARVQCARAVGVDYQRFAKFETSRTRTAPKWLADRVAVALGRPKDGRVRPAGGTDEAAPAGPAATPSPIAWHVVDDASVRVVVAARTLAPGSGEALRPAWRARGAPRTPDPANGSSSTTRS